MKKNLSLFVMLCIVQIGLAQVKVDGAGNTGMGNDPLSNAKLRLYSSSSTPSADIYGLHSFLEKTNISTSPGPSLYGAYFKNKTVGQFYTTSCNYGIYVDNESSAYGNSDYGVYVNNSTGGYGGSSCGYYVNNTNNGGYSKTLYGLHAINTNTSTFGATYGIYSTVSGGATDKRYSGYFIGGKFVIMDGYVGIGREPNYLLDVNGTIRVSSTLYTSDERLKTKIKPLSDEKNKLYLLQGKSYMKTLLPTNIEEDSLAEKREIIETPEYGYLAQELEKVFPDLVNQDSAGYYSVNYIGLIPVIVEALKDQRVEIEKQQEQIKQLVKLLDLKSIDEKAFEKNGITSIPLLLQNTPNPFNQTTEIGYYIPETVNSANIYIYDISGFQQKNISISERGNGATILQASALQAGIYFYTLICDGKPVDTKQMILTR